MSFRARLVRRVRQIDWDPIHWTRRILSILGKALARLWGRDVMLYVGGVSFFVMLAVFPGLAIMVGLYSLLSDPGAAAHQAELMSRLMPASLTKDKDCCPVWPSAGRVWVRYSSNLADSRLKPGVETFARLLAITSIAR